MGHPSNINAFILFFGVHFSLSRSFLFLLINVGWLFVIPNPPFSALSPSSVQSDQNV
jgi:hypothetical protein